MSDRTAVIYVYDGSFDGLMCCVWESLRRGERPEEILLPDELQETLFPTVFIETDNGLSKKMISRIRERTGARTLAFIKRVFLTCMERRETAILDFVSKSFARGKSLLGELTSEDVAHMIKAVRNLNNEAELLKGFVRFSDMGGVLVSVIKPVNHVLPLLARYFCDRFPDERLAIYDEGRGELLMCGEGKSRIGYTDELRLDAASAEEKNYRALWQSFYETAAIKERYNPRCRSGHMPKRYWAYMTEFCRRERYVPQSELTEPSDSA
ncbi:MAG: TIGR03915 family putative DNA repair protein [Oscillospiraceae bacterium]|nr:TIGR03915 family putative DNA repair protein [Oscillospiraceae bacterium]